MRGDWLGLTFLLRFDFGDRAHVVWVSSTTEDSQMEMPLKVLDDGKPVAQFSRSCAVPSLCGEFSVVLSFPVVRDLVALHTLSGSTHGHPISRVSIWGKLCRMRDVSCELSHDTVVHVAEGLCFSRARIPKKGFLFEMCVEVLLSLSPLCLHERFRSNVTCLIRTAKSRHDGAGGIRVVVLIYATSHPSTLVSRDV